MYCKWDKLVRDDREYYFSPKKITQLVPIIKTEGCYLIDHKGNRYIDATSQYVCVNLGHARPEIIQAAQKALANTPYLSSGLGFLTEHRPKLAKLIIEECVNRDEQKWASKVHFTTTGSEAVEEALMIAKIFTNRSIVITRDFAFHGWVGTAGGCTRIRAFRSLLISSKDNKVRDMPAHPLGGVYIAPPPFCYRCPLGYTYPDCKKRNVLLPCVKRTADIIRCIGPEQVAAVITEIIFQAGGIVPPKEYTPQIRKVTKELSVLWIDDEVATGFGRTGEWFAYQHYEDVHPDILTFGKGVTSAHTPLSGVVISKEIANWFEDKMWYHDATYFAHPTSLAAALANVKVIIEQDVLENVRKMGNYLKSKLIELQREHKCIGWVGGEGLLCVMEIVKNRGTKEPFVKEDRYFVPSVSNLKSSATEIIKDICWQRGVSLRSTLPNTLLIAPPLSIDKEEMDVIIGALDTALSKIDTLCN